MNNCKECNNVIRYVSVGYLGIAGNPKITCKINKKNPDGNCKTFEKDTSGNTYNEYGYPTPPP